jgi:hypothetical protein
MTARRRRSGNDDNDNDERRWTWPGGGESEAVGSVQQLGFRHGGRASVSVEHLVRFR